MLCYTYLSTEYLSAPRYSLVPLSLLIALFISPNFFFRRTGVSHFFEILPRAAAAAAPARPSAVARCRNSRRASSTLSPPTHQKEFDFFPSLYSLSPLPLGAGYSPLCVLRHHQQTPTNHPQKQPSQWLLRLYVHEPLCCKGSRSLVFPSSLLAPPLPRISWTQSRSLPGSSFSLTPHLMMCPSCHAVLEYGRQGRRFGSGGLLRDWEKKNTTRMRG